VALRWDEIDLDYDVLREVSLERLKASTVEQLEAIAGAF
jgi:hypothetical protein